MFLRKHLDKYFSVKKKQEDNIETVNFSNYKCEDWTAWLWHFHKHFNTLISF